MTFRDLNLNKSLLNALDDLGFEQATPIQVEAFPVILSGKDVIGIAQTGTGKTFAYLLPLIRELKFQKEGHPRILIVVPTRELVIQVTEEVNKLTKYMTARVIGVYGGTNINTQKKAVQQGADIVVATPGRLVDLALTGALRLSAAKKLVIDEVDEMLNLGFRPQLKNILDLLPAKRQNLLFSATMTPEVEEIIETFFNFPVKVEITPTGTPIEKINQKAYIAPNFNTKVNLLKHLLKTQEEMTKVLVFISTKKLADLLFERLEPILGESIRVIHSNKSQNYRINTVKALHDNEIRILIATDIIARGLDISEVTHVINFDTPDVPENYMHRVGRTGRADMEGHAISFIGDLEQKYRTAIEDLMNMKIPEVDFPTEVEVSTELIPAEIPDKGGDKNYLPTVVVKETKGAFHKKLAKNMKVNRANEKRQARKIEKKKARRKKKK